MRLVSKISKRFKSLDAQGTLEAAFIIPILMTLMLLLIQPAIVCYDLVIMKSASAQACRLASEAGNSGSSGVENFIRRRLSAIPQVDIFHVHSSSCSYVIDIEGTNEKTSTVTIKNKIKPLPLIDIALGTFGATLPDGTLELTSSSTQKSNPSWVSD